MMTATPNHSGERGASRRSMVRGDPAECAGSTRPQLPILYMLIMVALVFLGGGRFSPDTKLL
jgi:hypothetical protein